jgi:hypothetical protein
LCVFFQTPFLPTGENNDSPMFQLPFGGFIPAFGVDSQFTDTVKFESKDTLRRHFKMSGLKKSVIRNMELLVLTRVCSVLICWTPWIT